MMTFSDFIEVSYASRQLLWYALMRKCRSKLMCIALQLNYIEIIKTFCHPYNNVTDMILLMERK